MPASLTTAAAILKEIYEPGLQEQLNTEVVGLRRIERTSDGVSSDVGGRYVRFPLRVRRNQGIGYRQELEQLQVGGQQGYAVAQVNLAFGYGRLRISGQGMELAESNEQAFVNLMDEELSGMKSDVLKDCNRIFYGDGTGALAIETADAANTVTVSSTQYLEVGQVIDLVTAAGVSQAANRNITAINTSTGVVTYDGADVSATTAAGTLIVRQGNGPVSATVMREPIGLKTAVKDSGTYLNVDPAVEPVWKSFVDTNSGTPRPLSETLMISAVDRARANGGETSVVFCGLGVRRSYFNLLVQQRRFTNSVEFKGGFKGLAFATDQGDVPVVTDVDCPPQTMYGLDESTFKLYRDKEWHFPQPDGTMWKWVHDFDAWETLLRQYWQIGCKKRNANWVIQDITES